MLSYTKWYCFIGQIFSKRKVAVGCEAVKNCLAKKQVTNRKQIFVYGASTIVKLVLLLVVFSGFALAQKAALRAEIEQLLLQVESMEAAYWQKQESAIKDRVEIQSSVDLLDEELSRAHEKRNSLTEESFLVTENLAVEESLLEVDQAGNEGLLVGMREVLEKTSASLTSSFPSVVSRSIAELAEINTQIPAANVGQLIDEIIAFKLNMLQQGSSSELYQTEMLLKNGSGAVPVNVLRLGFAQAMYLGPNSETGLLLRTPGISGVTYTWQDNLPEDLSTLVMEAVLLARGAEFSKEETLFVPVDVVQAGQRTRSILAQKNGSVLRRFAVFFESGGVIMYPLAVLALLAVFIAIERTIFYFRRRTKKFIASDFIAAVKKMDKMKAEQLARSAGGFYFIALIDPFFLHKTKIMEETERLLEEKMAYVTQRVERRLSTLAILGTVAPLLGLLGTVSGMITLFDVITVYGTSNPKILAGGISIALVTTQAGLGIAIPILLVHHFLRQHKNRMLDRLENSCIMVLEAVSGVGAKLK